METQIKSYVEDFEHGMNVNTLVCRVAECLWKNHMVRTAQRLTQMGDIPALKKIYALIGEEFTSPFSVA